MTIVTYDNAPSGWNEALPLGNGHFGGMIYFEDHKLTFALNHYEVYYRKLHRYSKKYAHGEEPDYGSQYGRTFEQLKRRAEELYRDPGEEPIFLYGDALSDSSMHRQYGKPPGGVSHYPTGEIRLHPSAELEEPDSYALQLDTERADVRFIMEKQGKKLEVSTIVAQDNDIVVTEIRQTACTLADTVVLTIPARRYADMSVTYHSYDESAFYYTGSFYPDGEDRDRYGPFSFIVMMKLIGAKGSPECAADGIRIQFREAGERITLLTAVVTEEQADDLLHTALQRLNRAAGRVADMKAHHREYWRSFRRRSSVELPDKLLEDLWHINLYAIACSSGNGGAMREQACGLNGLWDIKQPTKWGSMWYWDVNIQAAFWPLYTANHLEIAEAFHEGLFTYADNAERMAKQFYGLDGLAGDYPHALYFSIWPWCAQLVWDYYRYSMDESFLREKAYPLFARIARFFEGYLQYDAGRDRYDVFPDISPEQGPLTRNSTCTLSSVKYLLHMAAEANERLGEAAEDRRRWKAIAERLAPYPTAVSARYGDVLLDSEWAPADLHLRHPSLLMPIYPIGEINRYSAPALRQRAANTLRYAEENTEFGMFQFGWLSCAASRLGKGDTALRLLYEQGIDLSLRCNGLFAEETERWMNYCNITNEPLYHPHMMEASGEIVAAVNEMLLQSVGGVIEAFPAVPKGVIERERTAGLYDHHAGEKSRAYGPWTDCAFRGLLAVGGFEVSARMTDGRTAWVGIRSRAGGEVVLRSPFGEEEDVIVMRLNGMTRAAAEHVRKDGCLRFDTVRDGEYLVYSRANAVLFDEPLARTDNGAAAAVGSRPRVCEAHTGRRVFLGKDRDTHHYRVLDHFTFDYYAGNARVSKLAAYRLDFGLKLVKDYNRALPRQIHVEGVPGQTFRKITAETVFTPRSGIGWESADKITATDRGEPDLLRRDFIGGTVEAALIIELPKGRYDLLIVSGDNAEPSYTMAEIPGQMVWKPDKALKAGEYATDMLPLTQRNDGFAVIRFRSCEGLPWRVNVLVINRNYPYL
ncbi:Glycosyl hydrolase family 65 central catalytic domain protein [Paenibacillus konkukensis]|uniref:Glycosyl hydrolase family 65 central catalytic domain protein n=1 Tax=Paenibacillus konkukensis TaxID=2020716 RepID=A0ABY4RE51_9BACL|nr:glycoside hydrolase N-terminal domain-containing protein [Paenibacillus konkukensis]UQZ80852.1 Glycosyl hydrolase family 65 central catalytic domain protein [Paenibacillus konkukensis]